MQRPTLRRTSTRPALPWVLSALVGLVGLLVVSAVIFAEWLLLPWLALVGAPSQPSAWLAPLFVASATATAAGFAGMTLCGSKPRSRGSLPARNRPRS